MILISCTSTVLKLKSLNWSSKKTHSEPIFSSDAEPLYEMGTEVMDEGPAEINYIPLEIEDGLYNMKRVIGRSVSLISHIWPYLGKKRIIWSAQIWSNCQFSPEKVLYALCGPLINEFSICILNLSTLGYVDV